MIDLSHSEHRRSAARDVQHAADFFRMAMRDGLGVEEFTRDPDVREMELARSVEEAVGITIRAWLCEQWGVEKYLRSQVGMQVDGDSEFPGQ